MGSTPSCSRARPTWVGEPRSISPALVVSEIVAAPVGVEAHRQAVLRKHLAQRPEGRGRAFLLDEKGRMDRPGRVIQRNNEIKGGPGPRARRGLRSRAALALEPGVARAVLMQHHPRPTAAARACADAPLVRRLRNNARPLQMQLQPGVAMSRSRGPSPDARGNA